MDDESALHSSGSGPGVHGAGRPPTAPPALSGRLGAMSSSDRLHLHDVHGAAGAVFGERLGRTVVTSYGDPAAEHAAARDGAGLVEMAERGVLEVSGPKRLDFLQGLASNDVAGRRPGQGCRAALMTAKGHVRFLMRLLVEEDVVHVETDGDRLDVLRRVLEHYRVSAPVRFEATPRVVLALLGVASPAVLKVLGVEPPVGLEDHARVDVAGVRASSWRARATSRAGVSCFTSPRSRPCPCGPR